MKKLIILGTLMVISISVFSQAPQWQWAKNTEVSNSYFLYDKYSATDAAGNVFITGAIYNGQPTLTDMFLAKYDPFGNQLWLISAGGNHEDAGTAITIDAAGNIYIAGVHNENAIFGMDTLPYNSYYDVFIAKFDNNGNAIWAKTAGGTGREKPNSIYTSGTSVYLTGTYNSPSIIFGTDTLLNCDNTGNTADMFTAKYDTSGNYTWARRAWGSGINTGNSITADAQGNVYVTGAFNGVTGAPYNSITFGNITHSTAGGYDFFLAKYDSSGNIIWVKKAGGNYNDEAFSIASDASGNIYLAGYITSSTVSLGTIVLINNGGENMFLIKYNSAGTVLWARTAGTNDYNRAGRIAIGPDGNITMCGTFKKPNTTIGTYTLVNTNNNGYSEEIFVARYSPAGSVIWVTSAAGIYADYCSSLTLDLNGNAYLTGVYESYMIAFGNDTISSNGHYTMFFSKLGTNCYSHYSTVYDSTINTFNLIVDSLTTAFASGYYWDFGDGSSSTLATPSHMYTMDSTYNICMKIYTTAGDSCEYCHIIGKDVQGNIIQKTQGFTINVQGGNIITSINKEKGLLPEIMIAPNPFASQTTIQFKQEQKKSTLKIMDLLGTEIKTIIFSGNHLVVEKGEMKEGIYIFQIADENNNLSCKKVILQ